jgi:hypothetical protein
MPNPRLVSVRCSSAPLDWSPDGAELQPWLSEIVEAVLQKIQDDCEVGKHDTNVPSLPRTSMSGIHSIA